MALKLGLDGRLYRNTGSYGTPAWVAMNNVKDLTLSLEKGEADVTTRGNNGWRALVDTLKEAAIEWGMVWDTEDAGFTAIKDAFLNNTSVEFAVMDGDIAVEGTQGLRATCMVGSFSRNEPLEEAMSVDVSVKPTYATNAPTWYVVPAP